MKRIGLVTLRTTAMAAGTRLPARPVPATTSRLASARARKDAASAAAAAVRRDVTSSSASGTPVRAS